MRTPDSEERDNLEIKDRIKLLPSSPGVYRFYDKEGKIIYIGKAKSLKNRVSQYFQSKETLTPKTRVMVAKIANFDHTVVESEEDALLLENNLIKEFRPRYNIMLKDDKTYPWICIKREPFPRVLTTRRVIKDGSEYFGPYASANFAHSLVELVHSLFYIRSCKLSLTQERIKSKLYRPCLNMHIGRCKAPCIGAISEADYESQITSIRALLKGDTSQALNYLKGEMNLAAAEQRFEEAHLFKEKIDLIKKHNSKSVIVNPSVTNTDVFTIVSDSNFAFGNYLRISAGSIIQSLNIEIKSNIEEDMESLLSSFISEIRSRVGTLSKEILVPFDPGISLSGSSMLIPKRGDKLKLLELSLKNAKLFKLEKQKQEAILRPEEHKERVVENLKRDLNLRSLPYHIECFDNSNIQGKHPVSACVVFKNGVPSKKDYRHFNIKTVEGPNDYASMKEVLQRRYSRLLEEDKELPQLIIIDGGKGQLHIAYETLLELGLLDRIEVVGIAKRLEEIIIPGDPHPLFLDKNSTSLRVIMHLRDEAHRFGITHHRKRRSKYQIDSALRSVPGVGEKMEIALLERFKSLKKILEAPLDEIASITGRKLAQKIKTTLCPEPVDSKKTNH